MLGGEVIGPLINKGDSNCILMIMSSSPIVPHPASNGIPSDDNSSVDTGLIRSRTYRQNGDGGQWRNNPSPHSHVKYFFFRCKIDLGQEKYFGLFQIILNKMKNNFSLLKSLFDLRPISCVQSSNPRKFGSLSKVISDIKKWKKYYTRFNYITS